MMTTTMSMIARSCVITVVLANTAAAEVEGGGVPCGVNKWWPHWGEFSARMQDLPPSHVRTTLKGARLAK